jgi:hypothetical protein
MVQEYGPAIVPLLAFPLRQVGEEMLDTRGRIIMNRVHTESIIDGATRREVPLQNQRGGPGMLPTYGSPLEETR